MMCTLLIEGLKTLQTYKKKMNAAMLLGNSDKSNEVY